MQPAPVDVSTLLRDLHPKQHGPYHVTLDTDWELALFHELALQVHDPVWSVKVEEITLKLNEGTANELRDPVGAVAVDVRFVPNLWPIEIKATILMDSLSIKALTPVLP